MRLKNFIVVLALVFMLFTNYCFGQESTGEIIFEDIDEVLMAEERVGLLGFGKGETWKMWESLHKSCMQSKWIKKPYFFGPSNSLSLGSIVSNNYEPRNAMTDYYFTDEELGNLIDPGVPANCVQGQSVKIDFNAILKSTTLDSELSAAIKTSKEVVAKIDSWQVQNLLTDRLKGIIARSTNPKVSEYKSSILTNGNKILVKAIQVNGFSSIITLTKDVSSDLKARLGQGLTQKLGDGEAEFSFELIDDKTISMRSKGKFYVFGSHMKAKKVKP